MPRLALFPAAQTAAFRPPLGHLAKGRLPKTLARSRRSSAGRRGSLSCSPTKIHGVWPVHWMAVFCMGWVVSGCVGLFGRWRFSGPSGNRVLGVENLGRLADAAHDAIGVIDAKGLGQFSSSVRSLVHSSTRRRALRSLRGRAWPWLLAGDEFSLPRSSNSSTGTVWQRFSRLSAG